MLQGSGFWASAGSRAKVIGVTGEAMRRLAHAPTSPLFNIQPLEIKPFINILAWTPWCPLGHFVFYHTTQRVEFHDNCVKDLIDLHISGLEARKMTYFKMSSL